MSFLRAILKWQNRESSVIIYVQRVFGMKSEIQTTFSYPPSPPQQPNNGVPCIRAHCSNFRSMMVMEKYSLMGLEVQSISGNCYVTWYKIISYYQFLIVCTKIFHLVFSVHWINIRLSSKRICTNIYGDLHRQTMKTLFFWVDRWCNQ